MMPPTNLPPHPPGGPLTEQEIRRAMAALILAGCIQTTIRDDDEVMMRQTAHWDTLSPDEQMARQAIGFEMLDDYTRSES